jgi:hypothetical protein
MPKKNWDYMTLRNSSCYLEHIRTKTSEGKTWIGSHDCKEMTQQKVSDLVFPVSPQIIEKSIK